MDDQRRQIARDLCASYFATLDCIALVSNCANLFVDDSKMVGVASRSVTLRLYSGGFDDRLESVGCLSLADRISIKCIHTEVVDSKFV